MSEQEQIKLLRKTLKSLMQSADHYVSEGSWLEPLCADLSNAMKVLIVTHPKNQGAKNGTHG